MTCLNGLRRLWPGNAMRYSLTVLDDLTEDPITDATVTISVLTMAGVAVSGGDAVAFTHTGEGVYRATLPSTLGISSGVRYWVVIQGPDFRLKCIAIAEERCPNGC